MKTPIDYTTGPFRRKYIDEETVEMCFWTIWCEGDDGLCNIMSSYGGGKELIINIPTEKARELVSSQNRFVEDLVRLLNEDRSG